MLIIERFELLQRKALYKYLLLVHCICKTIWRREIVPIVTYMWSSFNKETFLQDFIEILKRLLSEVLESLDKMFPQCYLNSDVFNSLQV